MVPKNNQRVGQPGHGLGLRIDLRDGERDVERSERDDERRQSDVRDQGAVQEPERVQARSPHGDREVRIHSEIDRELGHDDGTERHHHAARQIDARGENDQGLPDGDDADHHHLLQDEREVLSGQEAIASATRRMRKRPAAPGVGRTSQPAACARAGDARSSYFAPQHAFMPNVVSLLSTPDLGLSVMSVTPVSM